MIVWTIAHGELVLLPGSAYIRSRIPAQEASSAPVTPLGLRMSMATVTTYSGGPQTRLSLENVTKIDASLS
ncbi:hypothetical protein EVAR_28465_1 [Eumeta japonica]|uniref:Uncharacterized protein n=1 Tax=Eumeta variegata TaxID=151549 RepID=A0A4C1V8Y4_EUMVA|nr:hypothetical protein EVAR_28465_1 [Eumeta japonica]